MTMVEMVTADMINREHELARTCAKSAIEHAIRCGELLTEKKAALGHGEFIPWIETNCEFKYSTAARYMKAVKRISTGVEISSLSDVFRRPQLRHQRGGDDRHGDHGDEGHEDRDSARSLPAYPTWRTGKQKMGEIGRAIEKLSPSEIVSRYQDCRKEVTRLQNKLLRAEEDLMGAEALLIAAYRKSKAPASEEAAA
jgi:hypothetical protein